MYGIYSNSLERFILVDSDLWILVHVAKLLSSKMTLCVMPIHSKEINSKNCYEYGLFNPAEAKQNTQLPQFVKNTSGESFKGPPLDISEELFSEQKKFIEYLAKVAKASWIADIQLNTSDHNFLLNLAEETNLAKMEDDSGIDGGFKFRVDQVLYTSNTKQEMKERLSNIFDYKNSTRPSRMEQYELAFRDYMRNG